MVTAFILHHSLVLYSLCLFMIRYFTQDDKAGTLMTQTLASLPPSQKASFSRVQASIRAAYHRSVSIRRHAEFQAHLAATQPGASLPAHARADPRSPAARKGESFTTPNQAVVITLSSSLVLSRAL